MTFGRGSSLTDCAGTLAKHAIGGDRVCAVVEWDIPKGARIDRSSKHRKGNRRVHIQDSSSALCHKRLVLFARIL